MPKDNFFWDTQYEEGPSICRSVGKVGKAKGREREKGGGKGREEGGGKGREKGGKRKGEKKEERERERKRRKEKGRRKTRCPKVIRGHWCPCPAFDLFSFFV